MKEGGRGRGKMEKNRGRWRRMEKDGEEWKKMEEDGGR